MVRTTASDAIGRVNMSKIPYAECIGNEFQTLVQAAAISSTTGVISKNMGYPVTVRLFLTASAAATFAVYHSIDGVTYFHDTSNDVVFSGAGDKIVDVKGASFVKVVPSVAQTTGTVLALALYY